MFEKKVWQTVASHFLYKEYIKKHIKTSDASSVASVFFRCYVQKYSKILKNT